ncbi:MAG: DUF397 domain-containing protein [Streptosporangiaceae bacterium]
MDLNRAAWRKSSYSGNNGGACIEVAAARAVAVRDSKDPDGPVLAFGPQAWATFTARVKTGNTDT